jgi:DNA-binding transcriptional ArsR family regulator
MTGAGRVFRALSDPTRRQILQEIGEGELGAGEIASRFAIAAPSVSRHLAILRAAELIVERRAGNRIFYRLESAGLVRHLNDFLSAVCPTQMAQRRRMRDGRARR